MNTKFVVCALALALAMLAVPASATHCQVIGNTPDFPSNEDVTDTTVAGWLEKYLSRVSNKPKCSPSEVREIYIRGFPNLVQLPPNLFDRFVNLDYVDLAGNRLFQLPSNTFKHTTKLTGVNLASNAFKKIPDGLFDYTPNLVAVYLEDNNLVELNEELFANVLAWKNDSEDREEDGYDIGAFAMMDIQYDCILAWDELGDCATQAELSYERTLFATECGNQCNLCMHDNSGSDPYDFRPSPPKAGGDGSEITNNGMPYYSEEFGNGRRYEYLAKKGGKGDVGPDVRKGLSETGENNGSHESEYQKGEAGNHGQSMGGSWEPGTSVEGKMLRGLDTNKRCGRYNNMRGLTDDELAAFQKLEGYGRRLMHYTPGLGSERVGGPGEGRGSGEFPIWADEKCYHFGQRINVETCAGVVAFEFAHGLGLTAATTNLPETYVTVEFSREVKSDEISSSDFKFKGAQASGEPIWRNKFTYEQRFTLGEQAKFSVSLKQEKGKWNKAGPISGIYNIEVELSWAEGTPNPTTASEATVKAVFATFPRKSIKPQNFEVTGGTPLGSKLECNANLGNPYNAGWTKNDPKNDPAAGRAVCTFKISLQEPFVSVILPGGETSNPENRVSNMIFLQYNAPTPDPEIIGFVWADGFAANNGVLEYKAADGAITKTAEVTWNVAPEFATVTGDLTLSGGAVAGSVSTVSEKKFSVEITFPTTGLPQTPTVSIGGISLSANVFEEGSVPSVAFVVEPAAQVNSFGATFTPNGALEGVQLDLKFVLFTKAWLDSWEAGLKPAISIDDINSAAGEWAGQQVECQMTEAQIPNAQADSPVTVPITCGTEILDPETEYTIFAFYTYTDAQNNDHMFWTSTDDNDGSVSFTTVRVQA